MFQIVITLLLIVLALAGPPVVKKCVPIDHPDWTSPSFAADIRDQGATGKSWAFATTALIETQYAIATGTKLILSVGQITDYAPEWIRANASYCDTENLPTNSLHDTSCVVDYAREFGLMMESDYPFIPLGSINYAYDCARIAPIGITRFDFKLNNNSSTEDAFYAAVDVLKNGPAVIEICATALDSGGAETIVTECPPNHNVLLVQICQVNGVLYAKYQNSWGTNWGDYRGYGYLYIGVFGKRLFFNNRGVFDAFMTITTTHDPTSKCPPIENSSSNQESGYSSSDQESEHSSSDQESEHSSDQESGSSDQKSEYSSDQESEHSSDQKSEYSSDQESEHSSDQESEHSSDQESEHSSDQKSEYPSSNQESGSSSGQESKYSSSYQESEYSSNRESLVSESKESESFRKDSVLIGLMIAILCVVVVLIVVIIIAILVLRLWKHSY